MASITFAQLGCGRVAQRYQDVFVNGEITNGAVIDCCDVDPAKAQAFASDTGA